MNAPVEMKDHSLEIMVWISSTEDFPNWSDDRKIHRYRKVVEWHDYIAHLHKLGKVTHVWGSHQLLSRATFTVSQGVLVAVYRVGSWAEFDELLLEDPLRDLSQYATTPLSTLLGDRDTDIERYGRHMRMFLGDGKDPIRDNTYKEYRSRFNNPPEYVGKFAYRQPENPPTKLSRSRKPGDALEILIMGVNPAEYITEWDDARKLVHHEKVTWWHDYVAMLIHRRKISHAWGTNDFCHITSLSSNSCAAVAIYAVDSFEEFDSLYKLDPIRDATLFWSVFLQPIADQRRLDERRLELALRREKVGLSAHLAHEHHVSVAAGTGGH